MMMTIEKRLEDLGAVQSEIVELETLLESARDIKWGLVEDLKEMGHDFTASREGMDVVLSAPPTMKF
jgi:hypothetical protein